MKNLAIFKWFFAIFKFYKIYFLGFFELKNNNKFDETYDKTDTKMKFSMNYIFWCKMIFVSKWFGSIKFFIFPKKQIF